MIDDALTRFLKKAEDHYWDTFEQDRQIVLSHINQIAIMVRKEIHDEKELFLKSVGIAPESPSKTNQEEG